MNDTRNYVPRWLVNPAGFKEVDFFDRLTGSVVKRTTLDSAEIVKVMVSIGCTVVEVDPAGPMRAVVETLKHWGAVEIIERPIHQRTRIGGR